MAMLLPFGNFAQTTNRYMIFFRDKDNTPYTISQPQEYLSTKAIQRNGRTIIAEDLPVTPEYIAQIKDNNAKVIGITKWLNGALVELDEVDLPTIGALSFVKQIEYVAPGKKLSTGGRYFFDQESNMSSSNGVLSQHDMIGSDLMHADGYYGEGRLIAILDAGFSKVDEVSYFSLLYDKQQVIDVYNFVANGTDVYDYSSHGTGVFSTIAALGEDYKGIATKANYLLYITEETASEYRIEEYNWLLAAERADSIGVDIITTSLGYRDFDDDTMNYSHEDLDGETAVVTIAAEKAFTKGIVVISSAGNFGNSAWKKVTPPADGKHVLAIGAVDKNKMRVQFSSIGPINGSWIKPDVMAMGKKTVLIGESGGFIVGNGTSYSAPQVAGLVAGLWEKYPELSNLKLVEIIKKSADRGDRPDNYYGYGIPNYRAFENYYEKKKPVAQDAILIVLTNPIVDDMLRINIRDPNAVKTLGLVMYTTDGKIVINIPKLVNWGSNLVEVPLNSLPKGIYILKILISEQIVMKRIVKQ